MGKKPTFTTLVSEMNIQARSKWKKYPYCFPATHNQKLETKIAKEVVVSLDYFLEEVFSDVYCTNYDKGWPLIF